MKAFPSWLNGFTRRVLSLIRKICTRLVRTLRQPKWRHGRWSLLMMTLIISTAILLNVAVDSLEKEYGWRKDYSFNGYASTGEETKAALDRLAHPVTLYLLYQSGERDVHLLELLHRYDALSDKITVLPTDIAKNPGILNLFQGDLETSVAADSVIVNCDATGRYRVLDYSHFITQGYNIEEGVFEIAGLIYEKALTEAIVYVTEAVIPVMGILQGHGELTLQELNNFTSFLKSNAYDTKSISLLAGESLDDVSLLLIASPQKDFTDTETEAIRAFAQRGGSLLILRDYTDPLLLPNYTSLLKNYGVTPLSGVAVAGEADAGSYHGERIYLLPYMAEMDWTLPLIAGQMDILLLAGASAFEDPPPPTASLSAGTVLKTGKTAYLRDPSDGNPTIDRQEGDHTGELSLAIYAHRTYATGNVSRLFAIGSSSLLTDANIYQRTYSEQFLLQLMGQLLPQKTVSLDIMASAAFHPGLRAGGQTLGIALVAAVPLLTLVASLLILLPRRNR